MSSQPVISSGNGIRVRYRGRTIVLDPARPSSAEVVFVSHAHIDHIHTPSKSGTILASSETAFLSKMRGYDLGDTQDDLEGFDLIDSGHILGSKGLLIDGEIFYTGDFAIRPRAFLQSGRMKKCRVLIVESTYGAEDYQFPTIATILEQVNRLISDLFSRGIPVILMGHSLGKAQIISYLFSSWDPIYLYTSVQKMNEAYVKIGVEMRDDFISYQEAVERGLLLRRPWILVSPVQRGSNSFVKNLKKKYGAVTVAFTGWGVYPGYRYAMGLDHVFPLSDHCDFDELVCLVRYCEPEKVYTVHGFASNFASHLRRLGYDATPLPEAQTSMSDYLEADE